MKINETALKQNIHDSPAGLYLLYGEETYLTEQYAQLIARSAVEEGFDAFNCQRFDGQEVSLEQLGEAIEALPLMSDRKCVLVRDLDPTADTDRLIAMTGDLPEGCVVVLWQMTVQPDKRKGWQSFLKHAETCGTVVCFDRKTEADLVKTLVTAAKRRGCTLSAEDARFFIAQSGNDLRLLRNEIDKLTALAPDGVITRELIDRAATKNLEAKVFDLSKMILARRTAEAYGLLHQLFVAREDPLAILGVLSNAYADLYRGRVAVDAGERADTLAENFKNYRGKEWRLRNGARDAARMSVDALRDSLEILARTDTALKTGRGDPRALLEQTVTRLIERGERR